MSQSEPVHPAYDFSAIPEAVRLYQGEAALSRGEVTHTATGAIELRFAPTPRVVISMSFEAELDTSLSWSFCDPSEFSFRLDDHEIGGSRGRFQMGNGHMDLDWSPNREPIEMGDKKTDQLLSVVSHLFNFPDFRGGHVFGDGKRTPQPFLLLESEEWRASIHPLPGNGTKEAWERVKKEGGCLLTHTVKLERIDATVFCVEDAMKQILMLTDFLSFVSGTHLWPVCDVGSDVSGNRVWQSFCAPRLGNPAFLWASKDHGHQVETLFPLFAQRWAQSEEWRDCLHHAIYWYNQANTCNGSPGVDSSLILIQAALERLAFHHAVMDRKLISREGFKDLKRTSDKLRMLFSSLHIPLEIPPSLEKIHEAAKQHKWIDAPHAITAIRNSLVHPDTKKPLSNLCFEAWNLGLWHLELSILALCGYNSTFQNRFSTTNQWHVEQVPWSQPETRA